MVNNLENFLENLHLAIDQHRPSGRSKCGASGNSDLGNDSFRVEIRDAKHVDDVVENLHRFDRINRPLTSRDV